LWGAVTHYLLLFSALVGALFSVFFFFFVARGLCLSQVLLSTGFDALRGDVGNARTAATGRQLNAQGIDLLPDDFYWVGVGLWRAGVD
jgi:hypothetical protein